MKKPDFISAREAADLVRDGQTVCTIGMTLISACESILKELEKKYLEEGHPRELTLFHSCGQAAMKTEGGIQRFAHEGMLRRIIGGHWGQSDRIMDLIAGNKIEAFNMPQGQMANLYHAMAMREPGKLSKVGIGTYMDPRIEGGKMNEKTKSCGYDAIGLVTVDGEEYLQYKTIPIDVLLIRGTWADENGNISTAHEAMVLEVLPAVMAAKRFGGKVICQVEKIVAHGSISPKDVTVPGALIDYIVVSEHPEEEHRQTYSWYYDPSYSGQSRSPMQAAKPMPLNIRKVIGRRAAVELERDHTGNVGTGIPNDSIGSVLAEEGLQDAVNLTIESGVYGGVPAETIDFGISMNAEALIPHDRQFELYNGTGIDFTFMGAGEMDQYGNVNSTKMGPKAPGAGGFIDITSSAKNVIFCSTFTGGGLKASFSEKDGIRIEKEGIFKKLVKEVQQISYNGKIAYERGQNMLYVTERAVFRLTEKGPMLIEIAKGADLEKDILAQMEFRPLITDNLREIDTAIYRDGVFGLKAYMEGK